MEPVELELEKDTKRTYRFLELSGTKPIDNIYIKKSAFDKQPKKIRVTVEVLE